MQMPVGAMRAVKSERKKSATEEHGLNTDKTKKRKKD
jgi:hypothetical protein